MTQAVVTPAVTPGQRAALADLLRAREQCSCDITPDSTYEDLRAIEGCQDRYICPVLDRARRILGDGR